MVISSFPLLVLELLLPHDFIFYCQRLKYPVYDMSNIFSMHYIFSTADVLFLWHFQNRICRHKNVREINIHGWKIRVTESKNKDQVLLKILTNLIKNFKSVKFKLSLVSIN